MPKARPAALVVRELKQEDLPSLAELPTQAPDDGTLYQFPRVQQYPQNMRLLHIGWLRQALCDRTTLSRVAVIPCETGDGSKVVGFSSWKHMVPDPEAPGKTRPKDWRHATWMDGMPYFSLYTTSPASIISVVIANC
jgi:hypothetical protein